MKEESVYSKPCKRVKSRANIIVKKVPSKDPALSPFITEWWPSVIVKPDDNNKIEFTSGSSKGFTVSIPMGGHLTPVSTGGPAALWKKLQNTLKKKSASLIINKPTPMLRPLCTAEVWLPKNVPSDIISLNQHDIEYISKKKADINIFSIRGKPCIVKTPVLVSVRSDILVNIGQGEGETRWKGWAWKLFRVM